VGFDAERGAGGDQGVKPTQATWLKQDAADIRMASGELGSGGRRNIRWEKYSSSLRRYPTTYKYVRCSSRVERTVGRIHAA
jgi:hypothetical protein